MPRACLVPDEAARIYIVSKKTRSTQVLTKTPDEQPTLNSNLLKRNFGWPAKGILLNKLNLNFIFRVWLPVLNHHQMAAW